MLYPAYRVIQPLLNNDHTYTPYTQKVLLWAAISKTMTKTDLAFLETKVIKNLAAIQFAESPCFSKIRLFHTDLISLTMITFAHNVSSISIS